ncbi:MAG: LEA type 2 family protein [Deinococcales bacterium]
MRRSLLLLLFVIPVVLTACAPGTAPRVLAPTFTVLTDGTGFQYVDPPGVGDGAAVFDVHLRATNPNPVGITLTSLDGDFYLGGHRAAATTFRKGIDLPARGSSDLTLEVRVPLTQAPALVQTLAGLVGGASTSYRVDATVGVRILGTTQRFPTVTLARGTARWSLSWYAPEIRLADSGTTLRVDGLTHAVLELPATLHNPARLGYVVEAPTVQLALNGVHVATLRLSRIAAPAGETVPVTLSFSFNPLQLGPAIASQVTAVAGGVGNLSFRVSGPLSLQAPGIASHSYGATALLSGTVR